ncbi:MAG: DUF427 domain-containing protein [Actinomycetota bacterium]|nr:DUF427 domain-containing protein [Actinomycetota bacterium]
MADLTTAEPTPQVAEPPVVRIEPCARRVRVLFGGETVADTTRAVYLFEKGHLPLYYVPLDDVRTDLLVATDHSTHCPRKGDARYWNVVVGDRVAENAVWNYPETIPTCPDITGYVAFYWDRMDAWFEEDEQVHEHARDPYHRVDALRSSRHVQVVVGGEVVAETRRPVVLFETNLPERYYIPKVDVRMELLTPTDHTSTCPYKGTSTYWTVTAGDTVLENVAWAYPTPIPECPKIENLVCFFDEKVDAVIVDGVPRNRPTTPWS